METRRRNLSRNLDIGYNSLRRRRCKKQHCVVNEGGIKGRLQGMVGSMKGAKALVPRPRNISNDSGSIQHASDIIELESHTKLYVKSARLLPSWVPRLVETAEMKQSVEKGVPDIGSANSNANFPGTPACATALRFNKF